MLWQWLRIVLREDFAKIVYVGTIAAFLLASVWYTWSEFVYDTDYALRTAVIMGVFVGAAVTAFIIIVSLGALLLTLFRTVRWLQEKCLTQ